jgi:hypothetical protein
VQGIPSIGLGKGALSSSAPKARRVNDACRAIGISRSLIYKLAAQCNINLVHVAGRTLVPESEIERLASEGAE